MVCAILEITKKKPLSSVTVTKCLCNHEDQILCRRWESVLLTSLLLASRQDVLVSKGLAVNTGLYKI